MPPLTARRDHRQFADQLLGGRPPIGHRIRRAGNTLTIVGVVGDASDVGFGQAAQPIYLPYRQSSTAVTPLSLVVRTAGDPDLAVSLVKRAVWSVDPARAAVERQDGVGVSLGVARAAALSIDTAGGVRRARLAPLRRRHLRRHRAQRHRAHAGSGDPAGAWRAADRVWQTIALRSFRAVAIGSAIGVLISLPVLHVLRITLPETAGSALTLWPALLILLVTGAVAALWPAHRVTRADPVVALRD